MDISNMKNMIILKDLPSNIVDEAFVVLKSNKKIKNLEKVENTNRFTASDENQDDKEYVIREAEMIVTDYISRIEDNDVNNFDGKKDNNKLYKRWAYISSLVAILEWIILISS